MPLRLAAVFKAQPAFSLLSLVGQSELPLQSLRCMEERLLASPRCSSYATERPLLYLAAVGVTSIRSAPSEVRRAFAMSATHIAWEHSDHGWLTSVDGLATAEVQCSNTEHPPKPTPEGLRSWQESRHPTDREGGWSSLASHAISAGGYSSARRHIVRAAEVVERRRPSSDNLELMTNRYANAVPVPMLGDDLQMAAHAFEGVEPWRSWQQCFEHRRCVGHAESDA